MKNYKLVSIPKEGFANKTAVRIAATREFRGDGYFVEGVGEEGDDYIVRLANIDRLSRSKRTADVPDFLKKKEEDSGKTDDADEEADPDDDGDNDAKDDEDTDDDDGTSDSKDKGKDKSDSAKDLVKAVQSLVGELQSKLDELAGHADELGAKHDEKADKLDQIKDMADTGESPPASLENVGLEDDGAPVGPVPGGDESSIPPIPPVPKGPMGLKGGPDKRKPPVGVPATFSKRHEIVNHPGVNSTGDRITMTAAATELESDPQFSDYEVVAIKEEGTGYVAKLRLRS